MKEAIKLSVDQMVTRFTIVFAAMQDTVFWWYFAHYDAK